ncbi:hypothetical protein QYF36_015709 [Acer negundo]|nr:hypothetical protein QYF36_015709 [Acer negundo]
MLISIGLSTGQKCYDTGNFTVNSTYGRNRDLILSSLASNTTVGFYKATVGQDSDEVYALALCSGESSAEECLNCVNLTSKEIMTKCPNQKEAFMWGWQLPGRAPCYVRYSNRSFFGVLEQFTPEIVYNTGDITSDLMTEFNRIWQNLMGGLVGKASNSRLKFATEEANLTRFQTINALMQCTPDLSQSNCSSCLREFVADYQKCCNGKQGAVIRGPNCIFRWELYPFYTITATPDAPTPSPLPPPTTTKDNGVGTNSRTVVIIVFSIILFFLLVSSAYVFLRKRKAKQDTQDIKSNQGRNYFGMARLFEMDQTQGDTSRIVGTFGYMAPEYLTHGQFSVKSDSGPSNLCMEELERRDSFQRDGPHIEVQGYKEDVDSRIFLFRNVIKGKKDVDVNSGESSAEECSNCVNFTSKEIMTKCPNQKEAYMWGWQLPGRAPCYVRYSNRSFFGVLELDPEDILTNTGDITSNLMTEFNRIWPNLMDGLVGKASTSRLNFATEEANLTQFQTIYALMQCTPDLSQSDCTRCLRQYVGEYEKCCNGKQGGLVQGPNCISRWDLYPYYKITATPDAAPSPLSPPTTKARCINSTSQDNMTESPNQKEASCIVQYKNHSFSGKLKPDTVRIVNSEGNLRMDMTQFDKFWKDSLMDSLQKNSSMNNTRFLNANGDVNPTLQQTTFALMQCDPDLTHTACNNCLLHTMADYQICCHGKQGGNVTLPNCMLRWDLHPLDNDDPRINSTKMPDEERRERKENRTWIAVVTPISAIIAVVLLGSFVWNLRRRIKRDKVQGYKEDVDSRIFLFRNVIKGLPLNSLHDTRKKDVDVNSGESSAEECSNCVNLTSKEIMTKCPNQKEAFMWGWQLPGRAPCYVRYSNRSFFGVLELDPKDILTNTGDITSNLMTEFNRIWPNLMDGLVGKASTSRLKFATEEANLTQFQTIYALMQCTPDLSQSNCARCLTQYVGEYEKCCNGKQGGLVQGPNCISRWDLYPYYKITATPDAPSPSPPPPPPPTITTTKGGGTNSRTIVIIVFCIILFFLLVSSAYVFLRKRKAKQDTQDIKSNQGGNCVDEIDSMESLQFNFSTIKAATNDFLDDNKLGQGGFGAVYKGRLPNGQDIAVKRLSTNSGQGDLEFKNEVLLVAKLQHRNLVRLLGFCLEGRERLLIYEFVPNSSLDNFIFDFGMARLFEMDQTQGDTSRIVGTFGYMAPEYLTHGQFSVKSDSGPSNLCMEELERRDSFQRDGPHIEGWFQ